MGFIGDLLSGLLDDFDADDDIDIDEDTSVGQCISVKDVTMYQGGVKVPQNKPVKIYLQTDKDFKGNLPIGEINFDKQW